MRLPFQRVRDPWWDMDGDGVRRVRRKRVAISFAILAMAVALLVLVVGVPSVRAASTTVNLDQWASKDIAWQNGNLNGNNSKYPEGGIVPFRVAFEGLATGTHSIHINYDFTANGHKAYDFLATWDVTNAKGKICSKAGGAISSKCPSLGTSSSYPFPSDGYKANGLAVSGAEKYSAAPRRLTIYGGTITSIKGPVHSGSPDGNSSADFVVTFKNTRSAVLFSWGGHLAQSAYWDRSRGGPSDGAAMVSGAPWHMRTLNIDGAGAKNQDRSIQPSAISGELPPRALAPQPRPTPTPTPRPRAPAPKPPAQPPDPDPAVPDDDVPWWLKPPATDAPPPSAVEHGMTPAIAFVLVALAATGLLARRRRELD
jgi:hypothetical protein